jgi:hypothetical protein
MSTFIQNADVILAVHPSGRAELFVPASLTKQFPALTPHVFVLEDKEFFGPHVEEIITYRLNSFCNKGKETPSNG